MLKGLTSTFKEGCNNVELTYSEYVKLDNQTIPVKATLKDDSYENGNFIGTFILKEIQFETEATYEFRNKEFEYYKVVNGESIKIGTFISTDITINDTTEIVKVVGMDYGLKTQVEYTSALDYASGEITLKDVWYECCELSGLESGIDDFVNSDFIVDSDQFTGTGAMIRDVFKGIAMSSGSFVKVMNDDKVYLLFNEPTGDIEELEIDGSASVDDVFKIDGSQEIEGNTIQEETPTPDSPQPINVVSGMQNITTCSYNFINVNNIISTQYAKDNSVYLYSGEYYCYVLVSDYTNFNTFLKYSTTKNGTYTAFETTANEYGKVDQKMQYYVKKCKITITKPCWVGIDLYDNRQQTISAVITKDSTYYSSVRNDYKAGDSFEGSTYYNVLFKEYDGNTYKINLGENLFTTPYYHSSTTKNGITFTILEDGSVNVSGTATAKTTFALRNRDIRLDLQIGETYTVAATGLGAIDSTIWLDTYGTSSSFLGRWALTSTSNHTTAVAQEKDLKPYITIAVENGATIDTNVKLWVYKGDYDSSIEYTPYKTPIELCKIGTYQDRIYKENGTWYLHKEIGKVVLDGSEGTFSMPSTNRFNIDGLIQYQKAINTKYYKSNYYEAYNQVSTNGDFDNLVSSVDYGFDLSSGSSYTIRIKDTGYTSINDFKTWLSTHNTIVYYVLETPTTTEITDSELISQLNAIELLEGLNNISITSNDLTGKLKLTYYNDEFDIIEDYVELEDKRDTHPWTCLRLGMSNIDGENVDYIDEDLVEQYGENWLILNDNPFAYNQEKRQQLIMNIFNQIKAFGYSAFVSKVAFKPYLTSGDIIHFRNREKELVKSIILRYTHSGEQITLEAPSETSATVNYKYPLGAIDIAKQTQIIVDKDSVRIDSLTSQTQNIQDDLRQNYYTLEQTNELVQTAQTGLTNTFSEAGGNNIFRNTGLWFATSDSSNPYEFWNGVVVKQKEEKASNMSGMLLQNGNVSQEQLVPNGKYTISFKYNKPILLANAKVYINDTEYVLSATEDTEFIQVIEVSSQHINIRFNSDVDNGCEIYDLMVNAGEVKLAYSQNQNETTTDTVNISKGITITSSDTDVKFKADSDGIRTLDNNNNVLTEFTDEGMKTKTAIIESKSQIVGTLWQEVGGQTWITKL